jgi:cytochrome c553
MKCATAMIVCLSVATSVAGAQGTDAGLRSAAEEKAVNLCSTCHGPRGISVSPEFPILAAQKPEYLEAQIAAFQTRSRAEKDAHDFMWGIAGQLEPEMVKGLAAYYAAQPPAPELYDKGALERGIPACSSCHGLGAEGTAGFPRLAGQHAKYVAKQLAYIQSLVRSAPVMHGIVKDLTPAEIQAVAAYVESR